MDNFSSLLAVSDSRLKMDKSSPLDVIPWDVLKIVVECLDVGEEAFFARVVKLPQRPGAEEQMAKILISKVEEAARDSSLVTETRERYIGALSDQTIWTPILSYRNWAPFIEGLIVLGDISVCANFFTVLFGGCFFSSGGPGISLSAVARNITSPSMYLWLTHMIMILSGCYHSILREGKEIGEVTTRYLAHGHSRPEEYRSIFDKKPDRRTHVRSWTEWWWKRRKENLEFLISSERYGLEPCGLDLIISQGMSVFARRVLCDALDRRDWPLVRAVCSDTFLFPFENGGHLSPQSVGCNLIGMEKKAADALLSRLIPVRRLGECLSTLIGRWDSDVSEVETILTHLGRPDNKHFKECVNAGRYSLLQAMLQRVKDGKTGKISNRLVKCIALTCFSEKSKRALEILVREFGVVFVNRNVARGVVSAGWGDLLHPIRVETGLLF